MALDDKVKALDINVDTSNRVVTVKDPSVDCRTRLRLNSRARPTEC